MKKFLIILAVSSSFASATFAQGNKSDRESENQNIIQGDRPVKIIEIPKPKYPDSDNGTVCITGNARIRVQFLASGKIGEIHPVSELPYGATENAVEAARNINFEPAVKNGKNVTVHKVVVINFSIY